MTAGNAVHENVVGTLIDDKLTYTYDGTPYDPYSWVVQRTRRRRHGVGFLGEHWPITVNSHLTASTYKNHGDYVSHSATTGLPISGDGTAARRRRHAENGC